jgi:hypothetical protein
MGTGPSACCNSSSHPAGRSHYTLLTRNNGLVVATAANMNHISQTPALLHGQEVK